MAVDYGCVDGGSVSSIPSCCTNSTSRAHLSVSAWRTLLTRQAALTAPSRRTVGSGREVQLFSAPVGQFDNNACRRRLPNFSDPNAGWALLALPPILSPLNQIKKFKVGKCHQLSPS